MDNDIFLVITKKKYNSVVVITIIVFWCLSLIFDSRNNNDNDI